MYKAILFSVIQHNYFKKKKHGNDRHRVDSSGYLWWKGNCDGKGYLEA